MAAPSPVGSVITSDKKLISFRVSQVMNSRATSVKVFFSVSVKQSITVVCFLVLRLEYFSISTNTTCRIADRLLLLIIFVGFEMGHESSREL